MWTEPRWFRNCDVNWASWHLKSLWIWLFAQQLVQVNRKEKNQSTTLLALGEMNPMVTGGFPSQRASDTERISMPSYDICLWETWIWQVSQVIRGIYGWSYVFLALTQRYHHIYPWGLSVPGLTLSWFYSQHYHGVMAIKQIDGLVQERRNSSALAMELRLSCINPSKWCWMKPTWFINLTIHYSDFTWVSWLPNLWQFDDLLNSLFRLTTKKTPIHCIAGLCGDHSIPLTKGK